MPTGNSPGTAWRCAATPQTLRQRAAMLRATRAFFAQRDVLEVQTPVLSRYAIPTPALDSMAVPGAARFLRTSPELAHKRLLASGVGDLFEIGPVFRAGECGARHAPEFTLLEWYRLGFDEQRLMQEVAQLLQLLLPALAETPQTMSFAQAVERFAGIDVWNATPTQMRAAVAAHTQPPSEELNRDDWLDLLFATAVAPHFASDRLTFIVDYPASQAALAQISQSDPRVARRFEVFVGELELGNGFYELRDPAQQRQRFAQDNRVRRASGKAECPQDEAFLAALAAGLPECAGVAVGFDRLVMLATGVTAIAHTLSIDWPNA